MVFFLELGFGLFGCLKTLNEETSVLPYPARLKGQERMLKCSEVTGLQQVLDPGPRAQLPCDTLPFDEFYFEFFFEK